MTHNEKLEQTPIELSAPGHSHDIEQATLDLHAERAETAAHTEDVDEQNAVIGDPSPTTADTDATAKVEGELLAEDAATAEAHAASAVEEAAMTADASAAAPDEISGIADEPAAGHIEAYAGQPTDAANLTAPGAGEPENEIDAARHREAGDTDILHERDAVPATDDAHDSAELAAHAADGAGGADGDVLASPPRGDVSGDDLGDAVIEEAPAAEEGLSVVVEAASVDAAEGEGPSGEPQATDTEIASIADESVTAGVIDLRMPLQESFAQRLVAAREVRNWSREDIARKLHLPIQVIQAIETERYDHVGHSVYLRGYLSNYARLVGVPMDAAESVLRAHASKLPDLVASGRVSHSRYLIDRYSGSVLYLVLTGVIFVPLVMFAMNMGGSVGARLTPLDVPAPAATAEPVSVDRAAPATAGSQAAPSHEQNAEVVSSGTVPQSAATGANAPLMASFALVPNSTSTPAAPNSHSGVSVAAGQLRLSLAETSWVEIIDSDGKRLEFATLPAGTVRSYASDKPLTVLVGNTTGAKLEVGDQAQDMTPYSHGNVARFKLFAGGKTISAASEPHAG